MGLRKKILKILAHRSPHTIPEQGTMDQGGWSGLQYRTEALKNLKDVLNKRHEKADHF